MSSLNKCVNVLTYGFVQDGGGRLDADATPITSYSKLFGKLPATAKVPSASSTDPDPSGVGRAPDINDPVFYLEFTSSTDSKQNINDTTVKSGLPKPPGTVCNSGGEQVKIQQNEYGKLVGKWGGWKSGWMQEPDDELPTTTPNVNDQIYLLLTNIVDGLVPKADGDDNPNIDTCDTRRIKNIYLRVNLI